MNNWTKDIHNKLSNHRGKAPEGLLDDIKKEMMHRGNTPVSKRTAPLWYLRSAAAVIAAIILATGYYFISDNKVDNHVKTCEYIHRTNVPLPVTENVFTDTASVQENNPLPAIKAKYVNPTNRGVQDYLADNNQTVNSEKTGIDNIDIVPVTEGTSKDTESSIPEKKAGETREPTFKESDYRNETPYEFTVQKEKQSKFSFGAFYAGTMTEKSSAMTGFLTMADPIGVHSKEMSEQAGIKDFTSDSRTKTKHYQPVKVGASFKYAFNRKWGIQTGLTYSYLYSETNNVSSTSSYKSGQKLHYLGIPLNVTYSIWNNDRFNIYATAGGQIEKLVSGKIQTDFKINGADKNHVENSISENKIHTSVNLSAGAEFMFVRNISIYAEPGIVYYFDNKSSVESVYNQNSVKFNINVGLRYTLNN